MHVLFILLHKLRFPSGWTPHTLAQMQSLLITGDGRHLKIALACFRTRDYFINHNEIPRQITFELFTFTSFPLIARLSVPYCRLWTGGAHWKFRSVHENPPFITSHDHMTSPDLRPTTAAGNHPAWQQFCIFKISDK